MNPDLLLFGPPPGGQGGGVMGAFVVQMVLIVAIVYFLLIRPKVQQEKRHRERLGQIKKGDEVVTAGGIIGEVLHMKDDRITIKSGEARMLIERGRIADVRPSGGGEARPPA